MAAVKRKPPDLQQTQYFSTPSTESLEAKVRLVFSQLRLFRYTALENGWNFVFLSLYLMKSKPLKC